ncbi:Aste57867_19274 [Aphanomyces stellatus]|uniref:Aste57867_19274 protein n=1 Tax=Aphanomyces stellatus TaxID=120398 RepID=A0A485LCG1_9STRA|nr:hypothetical protein As57867_019210 [Aphanomyces stellatus]VFT95994.1 Aste57867_19274 [Aphanomyces stellatus]
MASAAMTMASMPPPLDYELQNVLTLALTMTLILWAARVHGLHMQLRDIRAALAKNHVAYVPNLGPSLDLLETMTVVHLQQFLRQQDQIVSFAMEKLDAPFDVVGNSVKYTAGTDADSKALSFSFQTTVPCHVQIYWGIDARGVAALHRKHKTDPSALSSLSSWWRGKEPEAEDDHAPLSPTSTADNADDAIVCVDKSDSLLFHAASSSNAVQTYSMSHVFAAAPPSGMAVIAIRTVSKEVQVVIDTPVASVVTEFVVVEFAASNAIAKRLYQSSTGVVYLAHDIFGADEFVECSICLENPTTVTILPCRHCCVCETCLKEIDACPICRAKFASYVVAPA